MAGGDKATAGSVATSLVPVVESNRRRSTIPVPVLVAIAACWTLAIAAQLAGDVSAHGHDALFERRLPWWTATAIFVVAWEAMIAAMMLPSSLPMVTLFHRATGAQRRPHVMMAAFLGGYALVWTVFGCLALAGDAFLHQAVHENAWLEARPWAISGTVLIVAGAFQFSHLKDRCLRVCRQPAAFLLRFYQPGATGAFRLGRRHAMYCLGCCWALMLLMFAAGVTSLWWMLALTGVMVLEKTAPGGRRTVPASGVVLVAWGALVFAHPEWVPGTLAGGL